MTCNIRMYTKRIKIFYITLHIITYAHWLYFFFLEKKRADNYSLK